MFPTKEPKLKTSCDGCSSAKVRCKKAAQSQSNAPCLRCVQQDIECIYGISQRKGKPFKPLDNPEVSALDEQQRAPGDQKSGYPWPKTGWNLSDIGGSIDFSSVELEYSKIKDRDLHQCDDPWADKYAGRHDMYSLMAYLSAHLSKADDLIDNTWDVMQQIDQLLKISRKVRHILNQALHCVCYQCCEDASRMFSVVTFATRLTNIYWKILGKFELITSSFDNNQRMAVTSLRTEIEAMPIIAYLIQDRTEESGLSVAALGKPLCEYVQLRVDDNLSMANKILAQGAQRAF